MVSPPFHLSAGVLIFSWPWDQVGQIIAYSKTLFSAPIIAFFLLWQIALSRSVLNMTSQINCMHTGLTDSFGFINAL